MRHGIHEPAIYFPLCVWGSRSDRHMGLRVCRGAMWEAGGETRGSGRLRVVGTRLRSEVEMGQRSVAPESQRLSPGRGLARERERGKYKMAWRVRRCDTCGGRTSRGRHGGRTAVGAAPSEDRKVWGDVVLCGGCMGERTCVCVGGKKGGWGERGLTSTSLSECVHRVLSAAATLRDFSRD